MRGRAMGGGALAGLGLLVLVAAAPWPARAATPDSPEVRAAVAKAVRYLESERASESRLGGRALVGLALHKNGASADHPKIQAAVTAIQQAVARLPQVEKDDDGRPLPPAGAEEARQPIDIYSTGLCIIFLCNLDPSQYGSEIQRLLDYLYSVQKDQGAWGYASGGHAKTCDTSMTQYGVLSSWEATQVGFRAPRAGLDEVMVWLLKTQDPSGQYGYQGTLSDTFKPVAQKDMKISMTAAGMGSLYIAADLLGLVERTKRNSDLPIALKEIQEEQAGKPKTKIDPALVQAAFARGNRWMGANLQIDWGPWTHYYLYALERYYSFREEAEGNIEKEPKWYNEGVRYLLKTQAADGHWKSQCGEVPDTAFGVLFLLRSTRKSIERAKAFGSGMLVGGKGLPKETGAVDVRDGKVVPKTTLGSAEKLLAALEDPNDPDYAQAVEALGALPPMESDTLAAKHRDRLRELAGGASAEARLAAVRALGAAGNLDNVPTLIYALGDPDPEVVRAADEGLRRISRRVDAPPLGDKPNAAQRDAAVGKWKAWYRLLRPDAELED